MAKAKVDGNLVEELRSVLAKLALDPGLGTGVHVNIVGQGPVTTFEITVIPIASAPPFPGVPGNLLDAMNIPVTTTMVNGLYQGQAGSVVKVNLYNLTAKTTTAIPAGQIVQGPNNWSATLPALAPGTVYIVEANLFDNTGTLRQTGKYYFKTP